jgi:hypothetical protein
MISFIFVIFYLSYSYAFNPSCKSCKFYFPHKLNEDLGLCELFKHKLNNGELVKNFASHCRNDENLCGKSGFLYESKIPTSNNDIKYVDEFNEQLNNMCCGEVNEKVEIQEYENMERELFEILQKMKKHNTKRIYKTSTDLYKLFKRG